MTRRVRERSPQTIARPPYSASRAVQHLQRRLMPPRVAGTDDPSAAFRGAAVPTGDAAAGAENDRDERDDVVGFQLGLDDEIDMAGREHAIGVAVAAVAREPDTA